jgi:hypothetical protein
MKATVTILTSFVLALCLTAGASAVTVAENESESFATSAGAAAHGWTVNDATWGWSNSSNAGSTAGEAGGTIEFQSNDADASYYGDNTLGGNITLSDTFSASGVYIRDTAGGNNDFDFIGHFNTTAVDRGSTQYWTPCVGILFQSNSRTNAFIVDDTGTTVSWVAETQAISATTPVTWDYTFDSSTSKLTVNLDDGTNQVQLELSASGKSATVNAFGLPFIRHNASGTGALYIDDVSYSSYVPEPATVALLGLGSLVLLRKRR